MVISSKGGRAIDENQYSEAPEKLPNLSIYQFYRFLKFFIKKIQLFNL
jgi:hypothetical protein